MSRVGIIERAFQLAPECTSVEEIRRRLKRERYERIEEHLNSGALKKDLVKLLSKEAEE